MSELDEIRRRVRNIWGAISSDQIVDKDVEGQAKRLLAYIDELRRALSPSPAPGVVEAAYLLLSEIDAGNDAEHINGATGPLRTALASLSQPAKGELPDRDTSKPAEQQGLFRKFEVRRTDGSDQPGGKHHGCRYFVIDIDHDQYATDALTAYADACARTHPELARDLREKWGAASPANPAQWVSEALSDCLDMLARFTHSTSNDLNHVEARAVYRAGRAALAAIGAAPKPPGWPDPLQSPQAEAIRNGKIDHAEILSLFDRIQREIDFHRSSPAEARVARLEAALRRARPYVDCAVHDDGGIDHCDIAYRFDLEAIDDALDVKEAG